MLSLVGMASTAAPAATIPATNATMIPKSAHRRSLLASAFRLAFGNEAICFNHPPIALARVAGVVLTADAKVA
jgi:hypothetical protein